MATIRPADAPTGPIARSRGWEIFWGILLCITGVLALLMPEIAALATTLALAWLLLFAGGFEIVHAVQTRQRPGFGWKLADGIITLLLGLSLLLFPIAGVATLALWIGQKDQRLVFDGIAPGTYRMNLVYEPAEGKGIWQGKVQLPALEVEVKAPAGL